MLIPEAQVMFGFSLSGLFLLTGPSGQAVGRLHLKLQQGFCSAKAVPCRTLSMSSELSEVQTSTAAVLLRQPFYESSYTDAVYFEVSYRSLRLIIFF